MPTRTLPGDGGYQEAIGGPACGLPAGGTTFGTQPGAGTPTTPAVAASPVTFTNATRNIQAFHVDGVAATTMTLTKRGVVIASAVDAAANNCSLFCLLGPGEAVIVTYSGAAPAVHIDTP